MKNIIVAGANRGIGYHMVKQLLSDGYCVTVLDLEVDRLDELSGDLLPLVCDIRDADRVRDCVRESVERFSSVDCAVQNACLCSFLPFEEASDEEYDAVSRVNFYGALHLIRAVLPYMKAQRSGKIILTSSGVGVMGFLNISPYASSKGALESLAKCLNLEYEESGIGFHLFHPPLTKTDSASPLPVPQEIMEDPERVGRGLAKNINKKSFVICHSFAQSVQMSLSYLFPIPMGRLMSKMAKRYVSSRST